MVSVNKRKSCATFKSVAQITTPKVNKRVINNAATNETDSDTTRRFACFCTKISRSTDGAKQNATTVNRISDSSELVRHGDITNDDKMNSPHGFLVIRWTWARPLIA